MQNKAQVILYHEISDSPVPGAISVQQFEKHLDFFQKRKEIIPADELLQRMSSQKLTGKEICITFDDGTIDFYENVLPILTARNIPATLFLISDLIGKKMYSTKHKHTYRLMDKAQATTVAQNKLVEIGSHCATHRRLTELSANEWRKELSESKETLQQQLGLAVRYLAYPFGSFNEEIKEIAQQKYRAAFSATNGKCSNDSDPHKIARLWINKNNAPWKYKIMMSGLYEYKNILKK